MSFIFVMFFLISFVYAEEDYEGESFIGKKYHENKPDSLIVLDAAGDAQEALDSAFKAGFEDALNARTCIPACGGDTKCQEITYVADTFVYPTRADFLNAVNKMDYCRSNTRTKYFGPPEFNWVPQDTQKETTEYNNLKLGDIRCGKCFWCNKNWVITDFWKGKGYWSYWDRETIGDRAVRLFRLASLHYSDDPESFMSAWNLVASYGNIYQILPISETCEAYGFHTIPTRVCQPYDFNDYNEPFEWFINVSPRDDDYVKCGRKYYLIEDINRNTGYINLQITDKDVFELRGGSMQICRVSAQEIPSLLPYQKSWENRIALGTIVNAQVAIVAWARAQCNSYSAGSCLLGIHDNGREDGDAISIPVLPALTVDFAKFQFQKDGYNLVVRKNSVFIKETQETAKMASLGVSMGISLEKTPGGSVLSTGFGSLKNLLKGVNKNAVKAAVRKQYKSFAQKARDKIKRVKKVARQVRDLAKKNKKQIKAAAKIFWNEHKKEIKQYVKEKAIEKGEEILEEQKEAALEAAAEKGNEAVDNFILERYGEEAVEDRYLIQNDYEQYKALRSDDEDEREESRGALKEWLAGELTHAIMKPASVEYWFEFGSCVGRCDTVGNYDWIGVAASITAFDSMDASAAYYNIVQSSLVVGTGHEGFDDAMNLVMSLNPVTRVFSSVVQGLMSGSWTRHLFTAQANLAIPNPVAMAAAKAEDGMQGILDTISLSLKYEAGTSTCIESDGSLALTQIDIESIDNMTILRENNTRRNIMQPYVSPFMSSPLETYDSVGPKDKMGSLINDIDCPPGAFISNVNLYECFECPINTLFGTRECIPYDNPDAQRAPMPLLMDHFFEPDILYGAISMTRVEKYTIELEEDIPYEVNTMSIFRAPSLRNHIIPLAKTRNIGEDTPHLHGSAVNSPSHIQHEDLISFNWLDLTEDNKIIKTEELNFHRVPIKTCDFFGLSAIELHTAYELKNSRFLAYLQNYLHDMDPSLTHSNMMKRMLRKQCGEEYEPAYIPAGISYNGDLIKYNDKWHSKINDNSNNPNRRFGLIPVREPECSYKWNCICAPESKFRYSTYADMKYETLEHNELMVPVTSLRECKAAQRFWGDSGLVQYNVEREWTSRLPWEEVNKLPVYRSSSNIYGCFKEPQTAYSNSFSFNTNIGSNTRALDCTHDKNVVKIVTFDFRLPEDSQQIQNTEFYLVDDRNIQHRMFRKGTEVAAKSFTGSISYVPSKEKHIQSYRSLDEESYFIDHEMSARVINNKLYVLHHKSGEEDSPFILQTEKALLKFHMQRSKHTRSGVPKIRKFVTSIKETTLSPLQHSGDLFTPGIPDENGILQVYQATFDEIKSFEIPPTQFDHLIQVPTYELFTTNLEKYATTHNMFMRKMSCMNKLGETDATVYLKSSISRSSSHKSNGVCDEGYVGKDCDVPTMTVYESMDIQLPNITGHLNGGYCGDVYAHVPPNAQTCENRPIYASHHCKQGMGMITVTTLDEAPSDWRDINGAPNTYQYNGKTYHQCVVCPEGTTSPEGDHICRLANHPNCDKGYFDANPKETSCNHRCLPGWHGKDCTIQLFESTKRVESHYSSFVDKYFDVIDGIPHPETIDWGEYSSRPLRVPKLHTKGGLPYADNEIVSQPKFLTCNDGFVPSRLNEKELDLNMRQTPSSFTSDLQRISARYANTCGGYVCTRCPDTYFEKNQVCVPCPSTRQVVGWAIGETGDLSNKCVSISVPKGHFFDALKPTCKHDPHIGYKMFQTAVAGDNIFDDYILRDIYENSDAENKMSELCKQTAWAGVCLHDNEIGDQTECKNTAVDILHYPAKYISSCHAWVHHPLGGLGAYQASVNQTYCDIAREGRRHKIVGRTVFNNGLPGSKPNADRTALDQCEDYEICNGEEVVGCQPGYIWFRDTPGVEDNECQICNNDTTVTDMHPEKEPYEYCDGTPYFRCAEHATHTDADPATFGTDDQGVTDYIASRSTWSGSTTERFEVNYANFEVPQINKYIQQFPDYYNKIREYETGHDPLNEGKGCYPTPDEFYSTAEDKWQKQPCEEDIKHMCVHRTSHKPLTGMPTTTTVTKYPNSNAVMFQSFDAVNRFEPDVVCLPGLLPNGCLKEKCLREGQSNCWCGDEDVFCTLGCVNNECRTTCGNEICHPDNEVCYGFNDISSGVSMASCESLCTSPVSNFCVINENGVYRYCRHYNENFDKPPLHINNYDSPCLDEVPNVGETQCTSPTEQGCFCGRHFINVGDSEDWGCFNRILEPKCNVLQDDKTCTYIDSPHGKCICGDFLTDTACYADKDMRCGVYATPTPSCTRKIVDDLIGSCRVTRLNEPLPEHDASIASKYSLENECDTYITEYECERVAEMYSMPFLLDSNRFYSEGCNYKDGVVFYNSFDTNYISQDVTVECPFGSHTPGLGGSSEWHKTEKTNAFWREEECRRVFEQFDLPYRRIVTESIGNQDNTEGYRYDGCQEDGTIVQFNMHNRRLGLGTRMCVFSSPYVIPDDEYNTGYKSICPAHVYTFKNARLCAHQDSHIDTSFKYYNITEPPTQIATCICENCGEVGGLYGCMDRVATNFDMYASIPARCIY